MWVQSLGQKAPLEEGMAMHSSILRDFHEQRSLAGDGPWGRKSQTHELATEHTHEMQVGLPPSGGCILDPSMRSGSPPGGLTGLDPEQPPLASHTLVSVGQL